MPTEQHVVKVTRNVERNLEDIERFLEENDATSSFDLLLDELTDTVVPNLEGLPIATIAHYAARTPSAPNIHPLPRGRSQSSS
ncbi:hypothetical protein GCM10007933_24030 [Zoogloea oryzae]|uniref:Type II toxin-antitoxin system RelE/ParE family toxin n=1 Tax=Zoogloea oryzae TaxID=310767 RepID=A0ABQ6FBJ7_9RHOO|nr:hypothetical protein GCM10007933_24030 [Zoogloea oryzae]